MPLAHRLMALISFPFYAKVFYPKPPLVKEVVAGKTNIQQVVFKIKGMSCESCTEPVNNQISKMKGIIAFHTSYENANSTVQFDRRKIAVDSIAAAINTTGYKVTSQSVTAN